MIEQFQHKVSTSFMLWFDNFLLKKGQAFTNKSATFYNYEDDRLDSRFKAFGSPFKQWVSDSSIVGADIPSGVWVNGFFTGRSPNVTLDFDNGRALLSGFNINPSIPVSGSFAQKDFNVYFTNETEDDLLVSGTFKTNPAILSGAVGAIPPYDQVVPAIFISNAGGKNEPFAFGGEDTTRTMMKAIIIAENSYQLDGVLSIFADSQNEVIRTIPFDNYPITEYGDVKSGFYSYEQLKADNAAEPFFFIEDVVASKLTDKARKAIASDLFVGFLDFEVSQQRYPRG